MTWLAHIRTITVIGAAFTISCAFVTQMMARLTGFDDALGSPWLDLGSLRLYAPFSFVAWTFEWMPAAPSLMLLTLCLLCVCALATYAAAVLVAGLEPLSFPPRMPWRDLASWRYLGDWGLLRDDGLALGAARCRAWDRHRLVRHPGPRWLLLGAPEHTNDALTGALVHWRGPIILVDGCGSIIDGLDRRDVLHFAPGGSDTLRFNPLLAIRGAVYAWDDARCLAHALLGRRAGAPIVEAFALLMLDQLLCAPIERRNLVEVRRRLTDKTGLVAELIGRWRDVPNAQDAPPATWEMLRAARALRAEPDRAIEHYDQIDNACTLFANAEIVEATSGHQIDVGAFLAPDMPGTLAISTGALQGAHAAMLVRAMLAQLVLRCGVVSAGHTPLIVIEASAAHQLAEHGGAFCADLAPPIRLLVQCDDIDAADRVVEGVAFDATSAIGPRTSASAAALSRMGGKCWTYERCPISIPRWRHRLFPAWIKRETDRLPARALESADTHIALLVSPGRRPARLRVLTSRGAPTFRASSAHPASQHDWTVDPMILVEPQSSAHANQAPNITNDKLRRTLTRKATPKSIKPMGKIL